MGSIFALLHWKNFISISFHIEWDMIVVTVFFSILNQMEFHLVQKIEEKLSPRSYPIQRERNGKYSFLSVRRNVQTSYFNPVKLTHLVMFTKKSRALISNTLQLISV